MKVLFHEKLCGHEFGSSVLHTPTLLAWVASKSLYLQTVPPLDAYDFVQVEALLCAVERRAGQSSTPDEAVAIIAADPHGARLRL